MLDQQPFMVSDSSGTQHTTSVPYPPPGPNGTPTRLWQSIILSHALRNVGSGAVPDPANSPSVWHIKSFAAYATPGVQTAGGVVAPGTAVV